MNLIKIIGVGFGINKRWQIIDDSLHNVRSLFTFFRRFQATIDVSGTSYYLDSAAVPTQYYTQDIALSALVSSGALTINDLSTTGISLRMGRVIATSNERAGYGLGLTYPDGTVTSAPDSTSCLTLRSVYSRDNDYTTDVKTYLYGYNGLLHLPVPVDSVGVQLKGGAASALLRDSAKVVAMYDFSMVGNLIYEPHALQDIYTPFTGEVAVTIRASTTGRAVMFSLGGYLQMVDDDIVRKISDTQFLINLRKFDLANRVVRMARSIKIDGKLAELLTPGTIVTPDHLVAFMRLDQSFAIIVDAPEIYSQPYFVKNIQDPSLYYAYNVPNSILVDEWGSLIPYLAQEENGVYALRTLQVPSFYSSASSPAGMDVVAGEPNTPLRVPNMRLIEIGRDV